MNADYDEKGKYFTAVIKKHPLPVEIQTTSHLVRGQVHVRNGERLKDSLDVDEPFLAVTDAVLYDGSGKEVHHTTFLAIQRTQIVWVMPLEDGEDGKEGGQ